MRRLGSMLLGLTACLPYGAFASLRAQDHSARARAAIRYVEKGERSDGGTRTIAAGPAAIGIDVNSRVDILVDEDALRTLTAILLPDAHRADLRMVTERIHELELLLDQISQVAPRRPRESSRGPRPGSLPVFRPCVRSAWGPPDPRSSRRRIRLGHSR